MLKFVVLVIIIQLFYGFGITALTHTLPADQFTLINQYSAPNEGFSPEDISSTIQTNLQTQLDIPLVDIGALVFYSGNLLLDLIVNFFTAVPSMITILITSYFQFFPVEAYLAAQFKLIIFTLVTVLYVVAFIAFIMEIRSGRTGVI